MANAADDSKDEVKMKNTCGGKREIITMNVGGNGVGIGQSLNIQYCSERGISCDGVKTDKRESDDSLMIEFDESIKSTYKCRTLMIDLDPYTINNIRNGYEYRSLLNRSCLINGTRDASCNFASAHLLGKEIIEEINNELRNTADSCDNLQGFVINHGLSGGSGTGITALILDAIANDYTKKIVSMHSTMHHETFLSHPTMVYNAILFMDKAKNSCDYSVILDNKSLYNIVENDLNIKTPRFKHYNCILNKLISSITAPSRYNINQCNLGTICNELIPFPSLKYLMPSISPIIPQTKKQIIFKNDIQSLTKQCTQPNHFMVTSYGFDAEQDKYIAASFTFRGPNVNKQKAMDSIAWIQKEKKMTFVQAAKEQHSSVQFDKSLPTALPSDHIITPDIICAMLANNTSISRLFTERICKIYDLLYSQRAYVHHYVAQGLEEGEFAKARDSLTAIQKEYINVQSSSSS